MFYLWCIINVEKKNVSLFVMSLSLTSSILQLTLQSAEIIIVVFLFINNFWMTFINQLHLNTICWHFKSHRKCRFLPLSFTFLLNYNAFASQILQPIANLLLSVRKSKMQRGVAFNFNETILPLENFVFCWIVSDYVLFRMLPTVA